MPKPRIAVFSGPTATVTNTPPLVTSNKARRQHGLPLLHDGTGNPFKFDALRPQRIAKPVTIFVEAFSAHPLERDAAQLSAPPDGWLDASGEFHPGRPPGNETAVYMVELRPEDGLYPLPYVARQADGSAWDDASTFPLAPAELTRQTFYPDASRIYEEIDRFGIDETGRSIALSSMADFDFIRAAPPGGYTMGLIAEQRTDHGEGDIAAERSGVDFHAYYPPHLRSEPGLASLARATNHVQATLSNGHYSGAQWLEGSPSVEETLYWLNLVIDTAVPIVGHSAQRPRQSLSADGDRNIVDGVKYLISGIALGDCGRDTVGAVLIVDQLVYSARDVTKADARPGGYVIAGGHGGVVADLSNDGHPQLTYIPSRRHTHCSDLRFPLLPTSVTGVTGSLDSGIHSVAFATKDASGNLNATALPAVRIVKYARYSRYASAADAAPDLSDEVEVIARVRANLANAPLAGFVCEGMSPYGSGDPSLEGALKLAVFAGMPVVRVGRGNVGGMTPRADPVLVAGNNLTSTKARMLLMASMLKLGALPPAADPRNPSKDEVESTRAAVAHYQHIFDTH